MSKYSKDDDETTSSYSKSRFTKDDDEGTTGYSRSRVTKDDDGTTSSYKSRFSKGDDEGTTGYSRSRFTKDDDGTTSSYTRSLSKGDDGTTSGYTSRFSKGDDGTTSGYTSRFSKGDDGTTSGYTSRFSKGDDGGTSKYSRSYKYSSDRKAYPGAHMLDLMEPPLVGYRGESPGRGKSPIPQSKEEFIYKDVKDLRKRVTDLEAKLKTDAAAGPAKVSGKPGDFCFSAVRTDFFQATHGGSVVNYDKILCNQGGHFSKITGTFHCPEAGHYFFSMHSENACEPATFDLMVDSEPIVSVTQGGDNWSTSGNSVIVPLASGQQVNVFLHQGKMSGYSDKPLASFCGFLVNSV